MTQAWAVFLASVVTASGGVVVALITKFRKENRADHQVVTGMMGVIYKALQKQDAKLDRVDERLSDHIESHHHK